MKDQIIRLLEQKDYVPLSFENLQRHLRVTPEQEPEFQRMLRKLERDGEIVQIKGARYALASDADLIPGRIRMNRAGKGFLQPDDSNLKEIAIAESATGTALHEDRVLVRRDVRRKNFRDGDTETGTVVRILERRRTQIVGTLQQSKSFLYVVPDDPRIPHDVYVTPPRDVGRPARVGDKVVVELREWEERNANPEGEIVEVLGAPDEEGVDMLSVLRQYNLPLHFPKNVLAEAHAVGSTVHEKDLAGRLDCRAHNVVTIDPDDAKDFDDAICLEKISPEQWRLWVHIADVSHYVKPGTALDEEARKRGNSTYLVDRVIPMLPEALSNELCSLKPNVDRLTKCVEFLVSADGRVLSTKFHAAVIHSQKRFAYAQVLEILQHAPADDPIEQMLHSAHQLAQKIRKHRFKNGSLELDFPETKIRLDENGKILRIEKNENDVSHQLIEEYMLLANEAVATRLMSLRTPAIYRVHEEPDARRLQEYRQDVLAHNVQCGNLSQPAEVQKLLSKLGTLPIGPALKIGFLKSLMRACYSVEPLGHYGLAKKKYTHFTSPIRRYADLVVHRALFDKIAAKESALKEIAEHISVTERNSADAERDSKDVKLFAFLKVQLESGEPIKYPALVTDVRNFGFFVDVTGLAMSGLVPLSTIEDDFYVFDDRRRNLVGRRTRRVIKLGDKLTVQVAKVDSFKKQVDFCLAVEERKPAPLRPQASRPAPARPQQFSQPKKSAPFRQENKRPAFTPANKSHWKKSEQKDSRPSSARRSDSRPQDSRSTSARREDARPPESKPMFRTSGSQLPTSQRPLMKASNSGNFSKRRR
ncbi:MAG TPA: ribonuclease R [Verrucomicrobiae bacterium]